MTSHCAQHLRNFSTFEAFPGMLQRDAPNLSLTIPFLFVARARKENRDWPHKSLHAWKTRLLDLGEGNLLKLPCTTARSKTFGVLESRVVLLHQFGPLRFRHFGVMQKTMLLTHGRENMSGDRGSDFLRDSKGTLRALPKTVLCTTSYLTNPRAKQLSRQRGTCMVTLVMVRVHLSVLCECRRGTMERAQAALKDSIGRAKHRSAMRARCQPLAARGLGLATR